MSVYDEVLCPQVMHPIMRRRGLTAAVIAGPDWPLIIVEGEQGCDALVRRHREHPRQQQLVFTQAPPGFCGCLISATLMGELAQRNRLSTIGGLLVYQPHAPQGDPIARDVCVQVDHQVRSSLVRATFDSPRHRQTLNDAMQSAPAKPADWIKAIRRRLGDRPAQHLPQHVTLELCTERTSRGVFSQRTCPKPIRQPISLGLAQQVIQGIAQSPDSVLTLAGAGDPLLHPHFDEVIRFAKQAGIPGVHVRTELLCDRAAIERLLASGVDVVSVDLNADRAATYQVMMGVDRFKEVLLNIEFLLQRRRLLTSQSGTAAMALPWVIPTLQRRAETYEDIDSFFDRWQHTLGVAVIADPPPQSSGSLPDTLTPAVTPQQAVERDRRCNMTILCDGRVPIDLHDLSPIAAVASIGEKSLPEVWAGLLQFRRPQHVD